MWLLTQVQPANLIDVDDGAPLSEAGIEGVPYYGEDTHARTQVSPLLVHDVLVVGAGGTRLVSKSGGVTV